MVNLLGKKSKKFWFTISTIVSSELYADMLAPIIEPLVTEIFDATSNDFVMDAVLQLDRATPH